MHHDVSYWPAFALTLGFAFVFGVSIQRTVIRPVERRPEIVIVIVTIGLLIAINGLVGWIWGGETKALDSPFPNRSWDIGGVAVSCRTSGRSACASSASSSSGASSASTTIGLAMRSSAVNPDASRLLGVRVSWMLAIGWGLAAVLGAVAGLMAAPTVFLDPSMMLVILIYAFAAAVLGGIDSPVGAVVGGLLLGVIVNLLGAYVDFVGAELRLPTALAILLLVLIIQAAGAVRPPGGAARMTLTALKVLMFAAIAVLIAVLPRFMGEFRLSQFTFVAIYFVSLLGLNILTGYNGQISLGHGAFMGIGAYVGAMLTLGRPGLEGLLLTPPDWLPLGDGMRPVFTIPLAGLITGVIGFLFGLPALRLAASRSRSRRSRWRCRCRRSRRSSTASRAAAAGSCSTCRPSRSAGTSRCGTGSTARPGWSRGSSSSSRGCSCAGARARVARDPRRRIAATASGVSPALYKTLAFGVSSFYAGVAGALLAIEVSYVNPDTFPLSLSILLLASVVVGGLGALSGVIFGALLIEFLPIYAQDPPLLPFGSRSSRRPWSSGSS